MTLRLRPTGLLLVAGVMAACGSAGTTSLGAAHPGGSGTAPSPAVSTSGGAGTTAGTGSAGSGTSGPASTVTGATSGPGGSSTTSSTAARATTTTSPPSPPPGTGAYGYVTAGPTCPVEQAGNPCPPQPVAASISAEDSSGRAVAQTRTDSAGRYSLALPPGGYTLVADPGSTWPRCPPTQVTVTAGAPTRADISCDTGIR